MRRIALYFKLFHVHKVGLVIPFSSTTFLQNYYCSVPPFQFEENEIEHIFRYHSREASKNLLRAFEDEVSVLNVAFLKGTILFSRAMKPMHSL